MKLSQVSSVLLTKHMMEDAQWLVKKTNTKEEIMVIECQYQDGKWKKYNLDHVDIISMSFRHDDERPVKIKVEPGLSHMEIDYLK